MNKKDALVGGGLILGGVLLYAASRSGGKAGEEGGEGSPGGQDEQNQGYEIPAGYIPGSSNDASIPDFGTDTFNFYSMSITQPSPSQDPGAPDSGSTLREGSFRPGPENFPSFTSGGDGTGSPVGSSEGAFGNALKTGGLIAGNVAINAGLARVASRLADAADVPIPNSPVARVLADPYQVRSQPSTPVRGLTEVGAQSISEGAEVAARTSGGTIVKRIGRGAAKFTTLIPGLGIASGFAIDKYAESKLPEDEQLTNGQIALGQVVGDVAGIGTILGLTAVAGPVGTGTSVVTQGVTQIAATEGYYGRVRGNQGLFGGKPSGDTAAPSPGGNSAQALMNNAQSIIPQGTATPWESAVTKPTSTGGGGGGRSFTVNPVQAAAANAAAKAQGGVASFMPQTVPVASQAASINYTPANANFQSASGVASYVPAPMAPQNVSSSQRATSSGSTKASTSAAPKPASKAEPAKKPLSTAVNRLAKRSGSSYAR